MIRQAGWALLLAATACAQARGRTVRETAVAVEPAVHLSASPTDAPPEDVAAVDDREVTRAWMRNVRFHSAPGVVLRIQRLAGLMERTDPERPPFFDEPTSFRLRIDTGEIGLGMTDLARLMNDHVFAYRGAPLAGLEFRAEGRRLRMRGILARRVPRIRVDMLADVCVVGGDVCMRPVSVQAAGIRVTGLMRLLGVGLDRFVDLRGAKGLRFEGRDLVLDPEAVLPSPIIEGEVTAARGARAPGGQTVGKGPPAPPPPPQPPPPPAAALPAPLGAGGGPAAGGAGDAVVLTFGSGPEARPSDAMPRPDAPNTMFFERGTLRFGRLFMVRTKMQIVDPDPTDPFEFDLARYARQLVAGTSRNQPDEGLLVVMPDIDDVDDVDGDVGDSAPAPAPGK